MFDIERISQMNISEIVSYDKQKKKKHLSPSTGCQTIQLKNDEEI